MIEIMRAILLGVVEGVTEFLPISSTGHLIVAERMVGFKDTAELFTVVIQAGAVAAVIWYYRHDLVQKITGLISGDSQTRKFWKIWVWACVPAGIAGLALDRLISDWSTPAVVGWSLILGGIAIWVVEEHKKSLKMQNTNNLHNITLRQAIGTGFFQVLALVPGVSRSGATIMGGLIMGLDRVTAASFSFYLSIPLLLLAAAYKLAKHVDQIGQVSGGGLSLIIGTVVSFMAAFVSINWLLRYVSTHTFKPFAYYRVVVGGLILVLVATNSL